MSVRKVFGLAAMAFSVALAVVVGNRMSAEAMAVVIGVVCGVAASIPMSALVLALTRRHRAPAEESRPAPRPPVVVVAPATSTAQPTPAAWPAYAQGYPLPAVPAPREFHIVGDETL